MRGHILIEILITLTLVGVSMAAIARGVSGVLTRTRSTHSWIERQTALHAARAVLYQLFLSAGQHPVAEMIKVHGDTIRYADGSLHEVMVGPSERRPLAGSSGVTVASPLLTEALYGSVISSDGSTVRFAGCALTPAWAPKLSTLKSVLAFGAEVQAELVIREVTKTTTGCLEFSAEVHQGMMLSAAQAKDLPFIRMVIPLAEVVTLYLSAEYELRRLSHRGSHTSENQPVVMGIQMLTCSARQLITPPSLSVACSLVVEGSPKTSTTEVRSILPLSPRSLLPLLLNRPSISLP